MSSIKMNITEYYNDPDVKQWMLNLYGGELSLNITRATRGFPFPSTNMPINIYHKHFGISRSGIMDMMKCPKLYWHNYLNPEREPKIPTDEMMIGQLVHTLILEPQEFENRYYILEKTDKRTKEGKIAYAKAIDEVGERSMINYDIYEKSKLIANAALNNNIFKKIIEKYKGNIEHSFIYQLNEVWYKSRPDYYNNELILDLKTAVCADAHSFSKAIYQYGLHIQAAMAIDALNLYSGKEYKHFIFFVVEKSPPYLTATYILKPEVIEYGRQTYLRIGQLYKECLEKDYWPSYTDELIYIDLPRWVNMEE